MCAAVNCAECAVILSAFESDWVSGWPHASVCAHVCAIAVRTFQRSVGARASPPNDARVFVCVCASVVHYYTRCGCGGVRARAAAVCL